MSGKSFDIDIAEFLAETLGFNTTSKGAYVMLMLAYYQREAPLPANDAMLANISGIPYDDWTESFGPAVMGLFQPSADDKGNALWRHPKIDKELERRKKVRASATASSAIAKAMRASKDAPPVPDKPSVDELRAMGGAQDQVQIAPGVGVIQITPRIEDHVGSPIDPAFTLTGQDILLATSGENEHLAPADLAPLIDSFIRYHTAAGTLATDWMQSWWRWFERKKPPAPSKPKPRIEVTRRRAPPPESDPE